MNNRPDISNILASASEACVDGLSEFLTSNPSEPLIATGSGGAETVGDFAALLYGARGGVGTAMSPYTFNSLSDNALKTSKVLLVSAGGHNNDIIFAAKRGLAVNPSNTASFTMSRSDRNVVRDLFSKAGSPHSYDILVNRSHDGFVSSSTPIAYYALLCRAFDSDCDIKSLADNDFRCRMEYNDGRTLGLEDLAGINNYIILQGSWGRPVAANLEGKMVESGLCSASVYDFRNYCHGRFIYTSTHLENSAVIMFISPREVEIARRIRAFLPASTKLIIIETGYDAPVASLDLLIKSTELFYDLADAAGVDAACPANPGRIDKRVPMWIPFVADMKKHGPLELELNQKLEL